MNVAEVRLSGEQELRRQLQVQGARIETLERQVATLAGQLAQLRQRLDVAAASAAGAPDPRRQHGDGPPSRGPA